MSSICRGIDERVQAFMQRPLEGEWPFLLSLKERGLEGVKLVISDSHSGLKAAIQQVFVQTEEQSAHATWREVAAQLEKSFPSVTEMMDKAEADVLAYFGFPKAHRVKIHSTTPPHVRVVVASD